MKIEKLNKGHYWLFNDVKYYMQVPKQDAQEYLIFLGNEKIPGVLELTTDIRNNLLENKEAFENFIIPEKSRYDIL